MKTETDNNQKIQETMNNDLITDYRKEGKITFSLLQEHKETINRLFEERQKTLSKLIKQADKHDLTEEEQRACLKDPLLKGAAYLWFLNHEEEGPKDLFELVFIISFAQNSNLKKLDDKERKKLKKWLLQQIEVVGAPSGELLYNVPLDVQQKLFEE